MPSMVTAQNANGPRICVVNDGPSNAITNSTTETAFNCIYTFPNQSQHTVQPTSCIRFRCAGIFSTAVLLTDITLRTRWGGISGTSIQSTGQFTLPISQTDMPWWIQGFILINDVGSVAHMESQFFTAFDGNATMTNRQKNATPIVFDTTTTSDVVVSAQWVTASASNSIQMRAIIIEVDGP